MIKLMNLYVFRIMARIIFFAGRNFISVTSCALAFPLIILAVIYLRIKGINQPKRSRVFVGIHEIANVIQSISSCLSARGYIVNALVIKNKFYNENNLVSIPNLSLKYLNIDNRFQRIWVAFSLPFNFIVYLFKADIFWMVWNVSFLPLKLDFIFLKCAGKKLIIMHCGDDVRYRPIQRVIDKSFGKTTWPNDVSNFSIFIRNFYFQLISERCGRVVSVRNQATFQTRPLYLFRFPNDGYLQNTKATNRKARIIHAPSSRYVKGTHFVLAAIDILKSEEMEFDFEILENVDNRRVLESLRSADIAIDQPMDWFGRFAIESMASGCCVIGGNEPEYNQQVDSPVIQFDRDSQKLASTLRHLIINEEFRQKKMDECFLFWRDYYSEDAFVKYFEAILEGTEKTFSPLPNQKELLLSGSCSWFEKFFIWCFYYPRSTMRN